MTSAVASEGLMKSRRWSARQSPVVRRLLIVCVVLVVLRYLYWRIAYSLPPLEETWTSWAAYGFCGLELFCAYIALRNQSILVSETDRVGDVEANLRWYGSPEQAPLIDVLIPTYDEGRGILRVTILAAARQRYPHFRVWVLDDGQRPWVAALSAELGVHYLARTSHAHFKAGNLNNALQHLLAMDERPAYFAVFDADFVAYPAFLERTVALMKEARVGIVQTPQHFYNPDPFQYAFHAHATWPEEWRANSFFLACRDARGFASCYGTSFLARIEAVHQVGGFPTASLLEDARLSARLAWAGWRTIYLNERLSVGLNVEGLAELRTQRARWYRGEMQILAEDWRFCRGTRSLRPRLNLLQRALAPHAEPALRLVRLVAPVIYWFTGITLVRASTRDFISYCLPMLAPQLVLFWLSRGAVMPLAMQIEKLVLAPVRLRVGLSFLFGLGDSRFSVTPKGIGRERVVVHWATLAWMASLLVALVSGLIFRAARGWPDPVSREFLVWNAAASALGIMTLLIAMVPCVERPRYRKAERYAHRGRVRFRYIGGAGECDVIDLSVRGARIHLDKAAQPRDTLTLTLSDDLDVDARVVRRMPNGESGVEFSPTLEQEQLLIELVLCSSRYVPQPRHWSWWAFCAGLLTGALRSGRPRLWRHWGSRAEDPRPTQHHDHGVTRPRV